MPAPYRTLDAADLLLAGDADWTDAVAGAVAAGSDAAVRSVSSVPAALEAARSGGISCVVTAVELEGGSVIDLLRAIREETTTLPVVCCTAQGSEAVAAEAIGAGATDYVQLPGPEEVPASLLLARLDRAIRDAKRTRTTRERARQFDASFHDDRSMTWVLDPAGSLTRVNDRARRAVDADVGELGGRPFWRLPWWPEEPPVRDELRAVVETAMDGGVGHVVVTAPAPSVDADLLELSARPVTDERGELVSIVVDAEDVSDRVDVERELRRSEELHRVTLNNMTDTVLITDEAGRFTYVCPNVHFIFGYTAEEIRSMETIEGLLGDDLFDRAALAEAGVLKNLECTATDKAGREHTLLVNVREVSIQDGTLLYSCRDITKRKQRERALTTLQGTAREFLFAETRHEIAQDVIDDVPAVLGTEASAVYLFDPERSALEPAATTPAYEGLAGPLAPVSLDADSPTSYCFVEDETLVFDDVRRSQRFDPRGTDVRSAAYIPLGEHGVFVAVAADVAAFDAVDQELADLLAASAEAALQRVRRESRLRGQERELKQRNRLLSSLNRVNEIIREIDQALVQAETRSEIEHAVCERLTADDRFGFAWIGAADPVAEAVEPTAWAGEERGYLDEASLAIGEVSAEPAGRTAAAGDVTYVPTVAAGLHDEPWRKAAIAREFRSVISVPLAYGDVSYGVLTVYSARPNAFDELTREVLAELGETIASATSAISRKNALLTPSMARTVLEAAEPTFMLSGLADETGATVSYRGGVQMTATGSRIFVSYEGCSAEAIEAAAAELVAVESVDRISTDERRGVLRLGLRGSFIALELAEHGAVLRRVDAAPSGTTLEVDVPEDVSVRTVTRLVAESIGPVELQSKQRLEQSERAPLRSRVFDRLTERQLEVLQTAYYSGFFESPRAVKGAEVAETLGISPQAFYQHVRSVQATLVGELFEEAGAVPLRQSG